MAARIGYPVLVRPCYVLGGRAMAIAYDEAPPRGLRARGRAGLARASDPGRPLPGGRLSRWTWTRVGDGERVVIGGILQHIEEAGVHSGDSAMVLPTYKIAAEHLDTIRGYTRQLGMALQVKGLMNVQYAIKDDVVYVLEVNPRASRTTPFVSKATGVPLAKVAAQVMAGRTLAAQGITEDLTVQRIFVKESVFPFLKFPGSDILLGPEMKSTGEVMGDLGGLRHRLRQVAVRGRLRHPHRRAPSSSASTTTTRRACCRTRARSHEMGFQILATTGTADYLNAHGVPAEMVYKVNEGRPNVRGPHQEPASIDIIFNTPARRRVVLRRRRHPQERHPPRRAGRDHPDRRRGHGAGDPGPARARTRRGEPAGDPRGRRVR